MNEQRLDAIARTSAGISRRQSAFSIGAAGLALLAQPSLTAAGKSDKKAKKRAKKQGKKKCKRQVGQCQVFVANICPGGPVGERCVTALTPCCEFLAQCQVTAAFDCIFENAADV